MRNVKNYIIAIILIVIAERMGIKVLQFGPGKVVLLPMLYALVLGGLLGPKFFKTLNNKDMNDATPFISWGLMILMAEYGTFVGPSIPKIIQAGPALLLQELGNLGTVLFAVPIAVLLGLKRETIGASHSIAREGNLALIADVYGMDGPEGRGVMGVYLTGTLLGTIIFSLMASLSIAFLSLHPKALAMASGVGSSSMMAAASGTLKAIFPNMGDELLALGATSNMLTSLDGMYISLFVALPFAEWLYRKMYYVRYGVLLEKKHILTSTNDSENGASSKKGLKGLGKELAVAFPGLLIMGCMALIGNRVGFSHSIITAFPGMLIFVFIAMAGIIVARLIPGKIPSVAFMVLIGCILTIPGVPTADFIFNFTKHVNFLSMTTPILAFMGLAVGKDLDSFKKTGWRLVVVSVFVFMGTYFGSAMIAHIILKVIGQI